MATLRACKRKRMIGHNVSHSNIKSKRRFGINQIQKKVTDNNGNKVMVKISGKLLRTWRKKGATFEALMQIINKGEK